jgi:hypothetical protein
MKRIFTLLIFLNYCFNAMAQKAVVPSGGTATGTGGTASFTIGLPIYKNTLTPSFYVEEGVQHPIMLNTPLCM